MAAATARQRIRYWFDNTMSRGTPALVGWLALASLTVVVVGGLLVWLLDPRTAAGEERGLLDSLWQSVLHALDPGTVAGDEGHWWYVAIAFGITVGGILIVTAFIGVLTTGLDAKLTDLRKGRSAVLESGHTVVLGWSDQVFTIIEELVEANSNQRRSCIAILADRDKVEMEDEIRAKVAGTGRTRIVCRTGDPADPDDIALMNPAGVRSVIVLPATDVDADAYLIKTLLAVAKHRPDGAGFPVVGRVSDPRNLPAARLAGGPAARMVDATDVAARLIVQTCLQSGLSVVYTDLLDFDGDEIYLHTEPSLVGWTYGHALHAFRRSSVIGLRRADGRLVLNPPSDVPVGAGDQLVLITRDDDTATVTAPAAVVTAAITARPDPAPDPRRTLVLGWNLRAPVVVEQLDHYVPHGSEVHVVARHEALAAAATRLAGSVRNLVLTCKEEDSADRTVLESLDVGSFDHVIVLCDDAVDAQLADSRALVTLLHLRDMEERRGRRVPVVSEMGDDRNRVLAQVTRTDDFIVSEKLLSLMTTQIAENPHLAEIFALLFDPAGSEIYLKEADRYVLPGPAVPFQTVVEAARLRGESAIGYRLAAHAHRAPSYGIVLNPDKAEPVVLGPDDRVIVLAED